MERIRVRLAILSVVPLLAAVSCATASRSQIEAARELTFRSDTVSRSPEVLFGEIADIRLERGLFYASSLTSADARLSELNALAEAYADDGRLAGKAGEYVEVFNSYIRALHSLSSEQRWKEAGTQMRGLGLRIDSVIGRYNELAVDGDGIPEGYARMAGRVLGHVAEQSMKLSQAVAVRKFVLAGDTLVAASCDSLMAILRSDEMNALIEHERESVEDAYSAYLHAMEIQGEAVPVSMDRAYVELSIRAKNLSTVRNRCVSALRSLKNAHSKLAESIGEGDGERIYEIYDELVRLNRLASQLSDMLD